MLQVLKYNYCERGHEFENVWILNIEIIICHLRMR